jgi:hypothetical protein
MHIHISLIHCLITVLEFLIAWIPIKLIAARFDGKNAVASSVLHVL